MINRISKCWIMWFLTALFYALDYFQHTAPSVLIEPIATSLNTSLVQIGNIMSIYFPIYAICQIPAGYLLDRYDIKYVLPCACMIISFGLLTMNTAHLYFLILGRGLIAIGSAFAFLGALKAASTWLPSRFFSLAVGLTNTIGVTGGLLGQPLLNQFILHYHWRHALLLICLFGLVLAFSLVIFLEHNRAHPFKSNNENYASFSLFRALHPQTWFIAIYAGIMVGTVVNAFSELYDVVFLEQTLKISSQMAADISGFIFIGIAVGGPVHGLIARFYQSIRHWMIISCVMTLILFSCIFLATNYIQVTSIFYVLYFWIGFFVSSMLLGFQVAKQQLPISLQATAYAVINMIIGLCGWLFQFVLGSMILWYKTQYGGALNAAVFTHAFWFLLAPLLVSLLFCFLIKADSPQPQH